MICITGHNLCSSPEICIICYHLCFLSNVRATYFGQLLDLVGIEIELLQGLLEAEDLLGYVFQAAVGVVQRGDRLLLATQAPTWHQPHQQAPLA